MELFYCNMTTFFEKILRSPEWASKYFLLSFSPLVRHLLYIPISLMNCNQTCIIYILPQNTWNLHTKSGHQKIVMCCRMGRENFLPHDERATKNVFVKSHLNPIPPAINNDRSLIWPYSHLQTQRLIHAWHLDDITLACNCNAKKKEAFLLANSISEGKKLYLWAIAKVKVSTFCFAICYIEVLVGIF